MANRLIWEGLEELRAELRRLPSHLAAEGADIVDDEAAQAKDEVVAAYETQFKGDANTGNLVKGVRVRKSRTTFGGSSLLQSTAPHAHLYEYGTQLRRHRNGKSVGQMPPKPTVVPIVVRRRRRMYERLADLVRRQGLEVSGTP